MGAGSATLGQGVSGGQRFGRVWLPRGWDAASHLSDQLRLGEEVLEGHDVEERCSEAGADETGEGARPGVGLGRSWAGDGDDDREPPKSRQLLEEARARRECAVAVDLRASERDEALGPAVVLEEDEAPGTVPAGEEEDPIWLRKAEAARPVNREGTLPGRGPGDGESRGEKEADNGAVPLEEVREEGRDPP